MNETVSEANASFAGMVKEIGSYTVDHTVPCRCNLNRNMISGQNVRKLSKLNTRYLRKTQRGAIWPLAL